MKKFQVDMYNIIDECESIEEIIEIVQENASYLEEEERNELEVSIYFNEDNHYTPLLYTCGNLEKIEKDIKEVLRKY